MIRMLSSRLFLLLSALVASTAYAAPSAPGPSEAVVDAGVPGVPHFNSYAGAPVDGAYPADVGDMGGWESDAPTYDTAVGPLPTPFASRDTD